METLVSKRKYRNPRKVNLNYKTLAYVVGVALGDGNLSNPNGRAVRLRVTCDLKYPNLIQTFSQAIQTLLPDNKISIVYKKDDLSVDISCYSNQWTKWLGWQVGKGTKIEQKISVPDWIKAEAKYCKECLRGLFQTDGSIYIDRGYKMVNFVTYIPSLANDVQNMIDGLGFKVHCYKIFLQKYGYHRYNIRLSRNVDAFIKTIGLIKN